MNTINLSLKDTYRATDVDRWQIVKTMRQQSVAEHSFQVALIASRYCDLLNYSESLRAKVIWHALIHDLPEVLTGDLSTPLKKMMGSFAAAKLKHLEDSMTVVDRPVSLEVTDGELIKSIVKVADLIEAVAFLEQNACSTHGKDVCARIKTKAIELGGTSAEILLNEILYSKEVNLDDVMAEHLV